MQTNIVFGFELINYDIIAQTGMDRWLIGTRAEIL